MIIIFDGNHFCGYHTSTGKLAWCTTETQSDMNGSGLVSVDGIVYGIYYPFSGGSLVEAINPQNGHKDWSQSGTLEAINNPSILYLGDTLILPNSNIALSRANGHALWAFPAEVLAAAVNN